MNIKDLEKACSILGIEDYTQFVKPEISSEIEKGVNTIDYKALYENQKMLNEKILENVGEISKSFDNQLENFQKEFSEQMKKQVKELEKSFTTLENEVNNMKKSPMRNAKSAKSVTVIEKSVGEEQKNNIKTLNLNVPSDVRELKSFLSERAIDELSKGVQNGIYERASLQLDSSRKVSSDLVKKIMEQDKILIR